MYRLPRRLPRCAQHKQKSKIFFGQSFHNKDELKDLLAIPVGVLPSRYLGIPLSINYLKARDLFSLIDKCKARMDGWSSITVSFAGRVQLVKLVIHSYLIYRLQSYKFPSPVIRILGKLMANFIWKNKLHACSCVSICRPKVEGGLGIRRLEDLCTVAGLELFWRCFRSDGIWSYWMRKVYCTNSSPWESHAHPMDSGTWKHIMNS